MSHPKETKIVCELYIAELQKEKELANARKISNSGSHLYEYERGCAKGLERAEKWFKEYFEHFLKEE